MCRAKRDWRKLFNSGFSYYFLTQFIFRDGMQDPLVPIKIQEKCKSCQKTTSVVINIQVGNRWKRTKCWFSVYLSMVLQMIFLSSPCLWSFFFILPLPWSWCFLALYILAKMYLDLTFGRLWSNLIGQQCIDPLWWINWLISQVY